MKIFATLPALLLALGLSGTCAEAQRAGAATDTELVSDLNETIDRATVTVALLGGGTRSGDMILTHFRPAGAGPFPVVVLSHGRAGTAGERSQPARRRSLGIVRYWVRRGFAVVVPTRLGYGATGTDPDTEYSGPCSKKSYGPMSRAAALQVRTAVAYAQRQPWADAARVILMGQSVGGLATTVAHGDGIQGVIGAINVAGGSGGRPKEAPAQPCEPQKLAAVYAASAKPEGVPMLWLYAENDLFWGARIPRDWHRAYTTAGGRAELAMLPPVGEDGHRLIDRLEVWRPHIDRYIATLGFAAPKTPGAPPPSNFAPIGDASKIPHVKDDVRREAYAKFLALDLPRAFVVSPKGNWAFYGGSADALARALERCGKSAGQPCKPYAVDDAVVWRP